MDESINTLKIMATSLGCVVEILRMVIVGDAVWDEPGHLAGDAPLAVRDLTRQGKLWVAEAFVTPNLGMSKNPGGDGEDSRQAAGTEARGAPEQITIPSKGSSQTPQLRVTFTGPTMSGKSSLLGTLSTGTLDNGRGKSRLSLLKHRHEVVSGVTSSIAQELIGYKDQAILNFSQGNVESWVDIHDCAEDGRLVFVSDSGGHPRYRRTVLRGLMNWAPHWSILCIAADDGENRTSLSGSTPNTPDVARIAAAGVDLVNAHLTLSLKLNVPLVVVITKLDLASKARLQKTLSKILSAVKDVGRTPKILQPDQKQHDVLQRIPPEDHEKALGLKRLIAESGDLTQYVPIVLTSSVKGTGVGLLHALLEGLPLPPPPTPHDFVGMALNPEQPKCLFHIDDTFSLPASYNGLGAGNGTHDGRGVVASGYLRFGSLAVGDKVVIGPFPPVDEDSRNLTPVDRGSPGSHGLSISHPSSAELARIAMKNAVSASAIPGEWHTAKVVSVRNLRLPVRRLEAGQAGSVGLYFELSEDLESGRFKSDDSISAHVRRGMVIAIPSKHMIDTGLKLQAASGFTATFTDQGLRDLPVGSLVNVYVASVRAAARVRGISRHYGEPYSNTDADDIHDGFSLEGVMENVDNDGNGYDGDREKRNTGETEVVLELLHNREWVELGSRVILLEGGSQYSSGLEGFVGSIVEILD
jgi:GTPase